MSFGRALVDEDVAYRLLQSVPLRAAQGAAKAGSVVASEAERARESRLDDLTAQYDYLSKFEVGKAFGNTSGVGTQIAISPRAEKAPELFFGPFLQLGTYLGIENDFLRIGVDILTDPLSWVGPGNFFKLSKLGQAAAVTTVATRGGKTATTAAKSFKKIERVLDFFGKTIENPAFKDEVLKAATGRFSGRQFTKLLKQAEGIEQSADMAKLLEVLKENRGGFATLIDAARNSKLAGREFTSANYLQRTLRGQVATGQRVVLQGFAPLPFLDRVPLIGQKIRDFEAWVPMATATAFGERGAKVVGNELTRSVSHGLAAKFDVERAFLSPMPGDITIQHVKAQVDDLVASLGTGKGVPLVTTDDEAIEQSALGIYKLGDPTATVDSPGFQAYLRDFKKKGGGMLEDRAALGAARQEAAINQAKQAAEDIVRATDMPDVERELRLANIQETYELRRRLMDPATWRADNGGIDLAIQGLKSDIRLRAKNYVNLNRDIWNRLMPKRRDQELVMPMWRSLRERPHLWEVGANGEAKLRAGFKNNADPFLSRHFELYPDAQKFAETVGVPTELVETARIATDMVESIGAHLFTQEHAIPEVVGNYVTRLGHLTAKGRKALKAAPTDLPYDLGHLVLNQVEQADNELAAVFKREKGKRGAKLSHERLRRATEKQLVAWEKRGWYKREVDELSNLGEYLDAVGSSVLQNRLFDDLVESAPRVTAAHEGKLAAAGFDRGQIERARGLPVLTSEEPSAKNLSLYVPLKSSKGRFGVPTVGQAYELANLESKETRRAIATAVGDRLHGKTQIGDLKLVDKAGNPVLFDSGWIGANSYPATLKEPMAVKAAVNRLRKEEYRKARAEIIKRHEKLSRSFVGVKTSAEGALRAEPLKQAAGGVPRAWVMKGFDGPIVEAFGLYNAKGFSSDFLRGVDKWNSLLKSTLLAVDIFHGNVMLTAKALANPGTMKSLALPPEAFAGGLAGARVAALRGLPRTALGAAFGASGAAALGADTPGEVAAGGLVGALWANAMTAALRNSILSRKAAMQPGSQRALAYAGLVGWNGMPNDRAIGMVGRTLHSLSNQIRQRGGNKYLIHAIDGVRHFEEGFQQVMWETIHNGGKFGVFQTLFDKEAAALAAKGGGQVINGINVDLLRKGREIMAFSDSVFGGQNYARLLRDPTWQVWYRRFALSPDWTSSRLQGAANVFLNMTVPEAMLANGAVGAAFEFANNGFDVDEMTANGFLGGAAMGGILNRWAARMNARMLTKGDVLARESRRMYSSALLAGFAAINLMNYAFQGRWAWENPEGDRLSVILPDGSRMKFGKAYKEVFEFEGADKEYEVFMASRAKSKLSPLAKGVVEILSNETWNGPIIAADADAWEKAGSYVSYFSHNLTPITAAGPGREASQIFSEKSTVAAGVTRGLFRAGGIDVRPPRQRDQISPGLEFLAAPSLASQVNSNLLTQTRSVR